MRSHYSDRIRGLSRGGSDSRLVGGAVRIRSLRAGLKRMFIAGSGVFGRRSPPADGRRPTPSFVASHHAQSRSDPGSPACDARMSDNL